MEDVTAIFGSALVCALLAMKIQSRINIQSTNRSVLNNIEYGMAKEQTERIGKELATSGVKQKNP